MPRTIDFEGLLTQINNNSSSEFLTDETKAQDFTLDEIKLLANSLENNTSVVYLDLSGNNITDEGIRVLASALSKNNNLIILILNNNKITDAAVKVLAKLIENNKYLHVLKVANNLITKNGLYTLTHSLRHSELYQFDCDEPNEEMQKILGKNLELQQAAVDTPS